MQTEELSRHRRWWWLAAAFSVLFPLGQAVIAVRLIWEPAGLLPLTKKDRVGPLRNVGARSDSLR